LKLLGLVSSAFKTLYSLILGATVFLQSHTGRQQGSRWDPSRVREDSEGFSSGIELPYPCEIFLEWAGGGLLK
jgi:hypothetical protein